MNLKVHHRREDFFKLLFHLVNRQMLSPVGVELVSDSWRIGRMSREIDGDRPRGMKGSFHLLTTLRLFIFTSLTLLFLFSSISISAALLHVEFFYLIVLISVRAAIPALFYTSFFQSIFQSCSTPLYLYPPFLHSCIPIFLSGITFPIYPDHFILSPCQLVFLLLGNV